MKKSKLHVVGKWLCIVGTIILVLSILFAFLGGSFLTPRMILFSMLLNSVGITLLRYKQEEDK